MPSIPVLTPDQLRAWDAAAVAAGTPLATLMHRAGHAVADVVCDRFDALARRGIVVACGGGNNGGDGWVAAQVLHGRGFPLFVVESSSPRPGIALDARHAALEAGVVNVAAGAEWPHCAVGVDALLGAGATGPLRGDVAALIDRLRALDIPIVAVDGPSGIDLENGDDAGALTAAVSVTFGGVRRGQLRARDLVGDLIVADIGMPPPADDVSMLVASRWAARRLAPLPARSHKGTRGRVTIIGGAPGMTGAARLAARGAFGAGAGLVHIAAPAASSDLLRSAEPDVQVVEVSFDGDGHAALSGLLGRADAVAIGPGLGRDPDRAAFCLAVIAASPATVVDADALVALSGHADAFAALREARTVVLTPHVGEFRTLFPECPVDPERNPWEAASYAAEVTGVTVLLKGVPTVVAYPGQASRTVAAGNPGLGSGGSGDVLSGIIASLLAQHLAPFDAAAIAAQALGDAADHAARRFTARGMRPMDVVAALPDVWRAWSRLHSQTGRDDIILLPKPRVT